MSKKIDKIGTKPKKMNINLEEFKQKPTFVDKVKLNETSVKSELKSDKMVGKLLTDKKLDQKIGLVKKSYVDKKLNSVVVKKPEVSKKLNVYKKIDVKKKPDSLKKNVNKSPEQKKFDKDKKSDLKTKKLEVNKKPDVKQMEVDKKVDKLDAIKIEDKLGIYKSLGIAGFLNANKKINEEVVSIDSDTLDDLLKISKKAENVEVDRILDIDNKNEIDKKVDSEKKIERDIILQRWLDYTNIGDVIEGTRFRAFKAPLKTTLLKKIPEDKHFTPEMLLEIEPNLGIVIDLTSYTRFYDKKFFLSHAIDYAKIYCGGKMVPQNDVLQTFYSVVERFLCAHKPKDLIIGINCTYGVNRSGYFICRYMIDKLGIEPHEAIDRFQKARGHTIGIRQYVERLLRKPVKPKSPICRFDLCSSLSIQRALDVYEEGYLSDTPIKKRKSTKSKSQRGVRKAG